MRLDTWKSTLLFALCFFISISLAVFFKSPGGTAASFKLGIVIGYFVSMLLKSAGSALLVFLLSGRRVGFFLAMTIAVIALMFNQIWADLLTLIL